jgi:hypothetical protein
MVYMLTLGVYWWQMLPYKVYSSTMDPMGFYKRFSEVLLSNPSSTSFQAMASWFTRSNHVHLPFPASTHLADAILQDVTEVAALAMTIHLAYRLCGPF